MLKGQRSICLTDVVWTGLSGPACTCTSISPLGWCHISTLSVSRLPFLLPAASIHWPYSVTVCSSQGVQEASTYKIEKPLSPQDVFKVIRRLLFAEEWRKAQPRECKLLFIGNAKGTFRIWEAKKKKWNDIHANVRLVLNRTDCRCLTLLYWQVV